MNWSVIIILICVVLAILLVAIYLLYGRNETNFQMDIGGATPRAAGGSDTSSHKTLSGRLIGFSVVVGATFTALIARIWSMQLLSTDEYTNQAEKNRTTTIYSPAPRGRILDRNGVELVSNRPSPTVIATADVLSDDIEVRLLGNLLGMPFQAVRRKLQETSQGAQNPRTISVDVSRRIIAYIGAHPTLFPGVSIAERSERTYPFGSMAAQVLGYTGSVTEEQIKQAQENNTSVTYSSGDIVGQTGIEAQYESVLQGVRGEQIAYVDAAGNVLSYATNISAQSGSDVMLTLDAGLQQASEKALQEVMESVKSTQSGPADGASAIVIDCTNGEILTMASLPSYDPTLFIGGISNSDWEKLQSEDSHYPMLNRAIAGLYPSGSIIKPVNYFSGLRKGLIQLDSSWYCTGTWTGFGAGSPMKCAGVHGSVDIVRGLSHSCNIPPYEIGKSFFYSDNLTAMQDHMRTYGFGETQGIDLGGEAAGRVPDPDWKWNYYTTSSDADRAWQGGDSANLSIGQGDFLCTALQIANMYCALANRGDVYCPHLLRTIQSQTGDTAVISYKPEVIRTVSEPETYRSVVYEGLRQVITNVDGSTWAGLSVSAAGKSGTAEQYNKEPIGWYAMFLPYEKPKYVVVTSIDGALWSTISSLPAAKKIVQYMVDNHFFDSTTTDGA